MPTDTKLQNLIINDLTEEQYKALTPNENEFYLTPDTSGEEQKKYYNHFILLTGTGVNCRFTITNSRPNPYTSIEDIYSYLRTEKGSAFVSATGAYRTTSEQGVISSCSISDTQGNISVSAIIFKIEMVENVPTLIESEINTTAKVSLYSDNVVKL